MNENQHYFNANKKLWNKKTSYHIKSDFYNMDAFLAGANSLDEIVLNEIGDVSGKSVLHLQCHFGQDSLSLSRMGAKVTAIDLSDQSIKEAQLLSQKTGLEATFICGNVYETLSLLHGQRFDMVFTSYGAICWLPDLDLWASQIAGSLEKGGQFYIAEFHPTLLMYDFDNTKIGFHYTNQQQPYEEVEDGTYGDREADIHEKEYFWNHSLEEVINALIGQGLVLKQFNEHLYSPYNCYPNMQEIKPGKYVYGSTKYPLPHVFSMMWEK